MEKNRRVMCPENEELANYLLQKRQELADKPKGIKENTDMTLSKAFNNICNAQHPIKTLKDLSDIKGVGKWIMVLLRGYFDGGSGNSEPEDITRKGKKTKGNRRYLPQKNSVAYALLITLYRETVDGNEFLHKQDLIDATEASGLSRAPIAPEKGKGKPSQFGNSPRDWYSGWTCMSTLIKKGFVVKSSCPAKYMLTPEGKEAARECLVKSKMEDPLENMVDAERLSQPDAQNASVQELCDSDLCSEETTEKADFQSKKSIDVPLDCLGRCTRMGYSKEQVLSAFAEVFQTVKNKEISSLLPAVLCCLREDQVYGQEPRDGVRSIRIQLSKDGGDGLNLCTLRGCSSSRPSSNDLTADMNVLSIPPLSFGERFEDVYEVILILDDREQFTSQGARSKKMLEKICAEFKIKTNVRRLPIGDGIWIARHKYLSNEYVLDFIVERKNVNDLRSSIRDNRYRDQKLKLLRSGLKKLIYLVEGDPNSSEAAESIKTACFTTEILEGFDVQRTSGLHDTLRKYAHLTRAITQYYKQNLPEDDSRLTGVCPSFSEFIRRCQELDKVTVSDVFSIQLMQVSQVTEEVAIAVVDLYPTLVSLAHAYSLLEGDVCAQEDMLRKQSNNVVSSVASKNIFRFVWG
ncbi:Crossover junction endonuclease MUS81 [Hibiscus syriacus]|uniref:Crossover junction endonuclease MUS81 n=1 Tax=Hibiscus syriacus TaxID=106335 RepID=A0A6A2Z3U5_HIBSY|nr:crossover junction endonuclease MUS81-like isoform X2 [Hibiscus syriacus]KAE8686654.1 Crossover junction endonuclease MUS81 [Hibiscus syriacus]